MLDEMFEAAVLYGQGRFSNPGAIIRNRPRKLRYCLLNGAIGINIAAKARNEDHHWFAQPAIQDALRTSVNFDISVGWFFAGTTGQAEKDGDSEMHEKEMTCQNP